MIIDKSVKIGVATSLIGSFVFLYLLEPILKFLSSLAFFLSEKVSSYFIDKLYQEIAIGKTDYSLTQMSILIVIFFLFIPLTLYLLLRTEKTPTNKELINRKNFFKNSKYLKDIFSIIVIIFFLTIGTLQLISSYLKVSSIDTFNQRIRILEPYIKENDKLLLISRFSSMTTYEDYTKIMNDIEVMAKMNKLTLPKQIYTYTY